MGDNEILIFPFVVLFVLLKNISCICTNKFFISEKLIPIHLIVIHRVVRVKINV